MGQEKGMGLHYNCCLVYVFLCILSCRISTGLISSTQWDEEWEVVFPSIWCPQEREQDEATIAESGAHNSYRNHSSEDLPSPNNQAAVSSREVRSVSSVSSTQKYFPRSIDQDGEQYEEHESHELYHSASVPWLSRAKQVNSTPSSILPHTLTSRSGKRNSSTSQSLNNNGKMKVKISAFGKDLYLLLKKDNRFLAPSFVVEERKRDKKESLNPGNTDRDCYYSGTVLGHHGSFASFSTCGGLMGFIQMNEDFIYIEPVNGTLVAVGNAHRVYRRKRNTEEKPQGNRTNSHHSYCGVTDKRRTKNFKGTETGRGKRYSYKQSQEYNIETVVVADPAMVSYHGSEATRKFILTILNMVYNLFQHKSLGVQMNLRVTKLILLHETPADMYIGHHGEKMLESFCKWQLEEFGKKNDVHMEMSTSWSDEYSAVDAAVLITRTDFCVHKDEPCDTVGIAYLNGMCSDKRKCIIAEDNGLNLAFTIAHEMGHNMGINHDNDHPSCADGLHIMSGEWIKGQNLGDVSWSRCSREDLEKFLRSKASNCLLQTNPQSISSVIIPSKLPGMTYTADEQCQILFGPTASFCQEMQHVICTGLWCKLESEKECRTRLDPPMDGTECGTEKWCRVGECTSMTSSSEHLSGEWSAWSSCSRTCGAGVHSRQRKCLSQSTEGRQCSAPKIQYKICENPRCPSGVPDFRDWQCQTFSYRSSYHKQKHRWHAVINEEKPCALFCSALGKDQPVLVAEKALDGTPCGPDGIDMCSNGRCQKVGCDGVLGSLSREDHCGVCNGNGKSCRVIKGDFNHTRGAGYVEALVIPAGARRIKVVEETPAHSYLALRDKGKQSINDDWKIEEPGTFYMAGTTVNYIRRGLWEKISAKGPTTTPLHLLVLLFHDQNYGLHYEYTIPLDPVPENRSAKLNEPLYMWTHSGWEDCDAVCGGGERRTMVSCTKIMNKNITIVDSASCKDLVKPEPQIRKCNEQPCQTRWMMTEWSSCSRTCGKGTQTRQTACTQQLRNGTLITAREKDCPGYKPASSQRLLFKMR